MNENESMFGYLVREATTIDRATDRLDWRMNRALYRYFAIDTRHADPDRDMTVGAFRAWLERGIRPKDIRGFGVGALRYWRDRLRIMPRDHLTWRAFVALVNAKIAEAGKDGTIAIVYMDFSYPSADTLLSVFVQDDGLSVS